MTILKPRSRIISIRLSEDELAALRQFSLATRARSLSDLARDAMRDFVRDTCRDESDGIGTRMDQVRIQIQNLEVKIEKIAEQLLAFKNGTS